MRNIFSILLLLFLSNIFAQSDTLNKIDENQMKQGYWVVFFEGTDKILEEGAYQNDKRTGVWKQHLENGTISSEITYIDDEPNGYAKIYYPNGGIAEEGNWKNDTWIGNYIAYYKNGNINYKWNFSEEGKRIGKQEYFHENGQKMISGNWENGQESGIIKRFNDKGELIEKKTFEDGKCKPELTVTYKPIPKAPLAKEAVKDTIKKESKPKDLEYFTDSGEQRLYDKNRRVKQEGYFERGQLIKGKKYYYNSEGDTIRIDIYNKGKLYKSKDFK